MQCRLLTHQSPTTSPLASAPRMACSLPPTRGGAAATAPPSSCTPGGCWQVGGAHGMPRPMPCVLLLGCFAGQVLGNSRMRPASRQERHLYACPSQSCNFECQLHATHPHTHATTHPTTHPPTHTPNHPPAGGGLAGYQQQDAHEFFCFVLEMMAATAGPGEPLSARLELRSSRGDVALSTCIRVLWPPSGLGCRRPCHQLTYLTTPPCPSGTPTPFADNITQRVFGGTLRSDLVCACCGHVSTSHEQFSHLSLDIPPPQQVQRAGRLCVYVVWYSLPAYRCRPQSTYGFGTASACRRRPQSTSGFGTASALPPHGRYQHHLPLPQPACS